MSSAGGSVIQSVRLYTRPRMLAVFFFGVASGLPLALSGSTLSAWLYRTGVSFESIGLFSVLGVPYALKFVWAPLIDSVHLPFLTGRFGRRRGWLFFVQGLLVLALLGLASSSPEQSLWLTAWFAFLVALCSATQDIVIDAYRVELLPEDEQGAGAATVVLGYRLGMWVSLGGALILAGFLPWPVVFMLMIIPLLLGSVTALLIGEPHPRVRPDVDRDTSLTPESARRLKRARGWALLTLLALVTILSISSLHETLGWFELRRSLALYLGGFAVVALLLLVTLFMVPARQTERLHPARQWMLTSFLAPFADFMGREGWRTILLFVLLFKFGDAFSMAMLNPFLLDIGFSEADIGFASGTLGIVTGSIGVVLGGVMVSRLGLISSLWISGILQIITNLAFVVQAQMGAELWLLYITITADSVSGGMGTAAFIAFISRLCNLHFTATQYALLSSFAAVGRTMLNASAGFFVTPLGWEGFFVLALVLAVPGVLLLLRVRHYVVEHSSPSKNEQKPEC